MGKQYWLVKSEPSAYAFDNLVRDGRTAWTGVRNSEARNNLNKMAQGDRVLFYHSNEGKCVVGVAEVRATAVDDETLPGQGWVSVELAPVEKLDHPVTLAQIKADPALKELPLITRSRLSVSQVRAGDYRHILMLAKQTRG